MRIPGRLALPTCYNRRPMKTLYYLPLAYMAGVHGFVFFAPYLAVVLTAMHFLRRSRAI